MLFSEKTNSRLNTQINREQYSSHLYLAMAAALEKMGLKIFAQYYYNQAAEETAHAMKMFKYVVDGGGTVILEGIDDPRTKYDSVEEIVTLARDHEIKVTNWIHELVAFADKEKDYSTRSFLQWYVDEQVQEVSAAEELVSLVSMAGLGGMLYLENRLMGMMPKPEA